MLGTLVATARRRCYGLFHGCALQLEQQVLVAKHACLMEVIWKICRNGTSRQLSGDITALRCCVSAGVVKGLTDVVKQAQKEKVVRVGLMALHNLLQHKELGLAGDAVEAGLPKVVATRALQVGRKILVRSSLEKGTVAKNQLWTCRDIGA